MARPCGKLRIIMSARVLLNLEEADEVFAKHGAKTYREYLEKHRVEAGPLMPLAKKLIAINDNAPQDKPLVEIIVSMKDKMDTAGIIFNELVTQGIGDHGMRLSTSGKPITPTHLKKLKADLFLSRNMKDVQTAIDSDIAAAQIRLPEKKSFIKDYQRAAKAREQIHLCFDFDAVVGGDNSEIFYKENGLQKYRQREKELKNEPIEAGPFLELIKKLQEINAEFKEGQEPFLLSLLTARGGDATMRLAKTFHHHGLQFNGDILCLQGSSKSEIIALDLPDIFFDDQDIHLKDSALHAPAGLVPYKTGSPMHDWHKA